MADLSKIKGNGAIEVVKYPALELVEKLCELRRTLPDTPANREYIRNYAKAHDFKIPIVFDDEEVQSDTEKIIVKVEFEEKNGKTKQGGKEKPHQKSKTKKGRSGKNRRRNN